ncbi:MAG: SDR family oxidoreductase [Aeromicrobium sp.]|nr:SDR family oxidoreductase [Burkholderiales bacterium]
MSPFNLHGKRILVTGASSGIGRAVAVSCARAGASLVITGRDESRLTETLTAMSGTGHAAVIADLTDAAQVSSLVEQSGAVHGLVHSAGIAGVMPFRMLGRPFLDDVFDTNFVAPVLLTQQLLARKRVVDGGSILFMTSLAAHTGTVGVAAYSASKTALLGAIRCLALEVAKRGIRVNSLSPGLVATPILGETLEWLEEKARMYPLGLGQPDDIAHAAQFFLSDASRKITGITFNIDGGVPFTY